MKAVTKLIPVSALALSLVVFTSCRIENIVPELEPYLQEVTGSDSTSFMSALSAAQPGNSTADFKEGFKSGYSAGYAEAAKKYIGNAHAAPAYPTSSSVKTVAAASTPSYTAPTIPVAATTASNNSQIPSWGYTSNASATVSNPTTAVKKKPSYSSKSSSSTRYSRSRRGCAGGS